jgi:hypothetical protein
MAIDWTVAGILSRRYEWIASFSTPQQATLTDADARSSRGWLEKF